MKTKLEKVLLAACIILVLLNGALMFMILIPDFEMEAKHIYINTNVPNSKKFTKTLPHWLDVIESVTNIGDGTFFYHQLIYPYDLRIRDTENKHGLYGEDILSEKISHKFENQIFYGYFKDGFAIVYPESNLCKVLRVSRPDYYEGRSFDYDTCEDGSYIIKKAEPEDESKKKFIIYLDSFDEYTEYEQKMLNSLVERSKEG
jgi:hypothetical protein